MWIVLVGSASARRECNRSIKAMAASTEDRAKSLVFVLKPALRCVGAVELAKEGICQPLW